MTSPTSDKAENRSFTDSIPVLNDGPVEQLRHKALSDLSYYERQADNASTERARALERADEWLQECDRWNTKANELRGFIAHHFPGGLSSENESLTEANDGE